MMTKKEIVYDVLLMFLWFLATTVAVCLSLLLVLYAVGGLVITYHLEKSHLTSGTLLIVGLALVVYINNRFSNFVLKKLNDFGLRFRTTKNQNVDV